MKHLKTVAAVAFAAMMTMASCNKDTGGLDGSEEGTTSVKIQVTYPRNAGTRALGDKVTDGTLLTLKPGYIFFCNATGLIDTRVEIIATGTAADGQVTLADINAGEAVIEGVSSGAKSCYIISNIPAAVASTLATETNINAVLAKTLAVGDINSANGSVDDVAMYGMGTVSADIDVTGGVGTPYTASVKVEIDALASRLQIGKISAVASGTGANEVVITDFTVEGIYINHAWSEMTLGSVLAATPQIDNGMNGDYSATGYASYSVLRDNGGAATLDPRQLAAGTGKVWAYNLFPGEAAHIIIKITNIAYKFGGVAQTPIAGPMYLTVDSFKLTSDSSEVTEFEPTNIYTLDNIAFDYTDLTERPYEETVDVLVEVTMMPWQDNPIVWNKN